MHVLLPLVLNLHRLRDINLGDRVEPGEGSLVYVSDVVYAAVSVDVPLSGPSLFVSGCVGARRARDMSAELVVVLGSCVRSNAESVIRPETPVQCAL